MSDPMPLSQSAKPKSGLDRKIMTAVFAITAVDAIGMGIILPLLPFYASHFGANAFIIGLLVSAFSACQFLSGPFIGHLSDTKGRKPVLLISQLGTFLSFIMLAFAPNLIILFLARILDGLTSGNISTVAAIAMDSAPPQERRQASGIFSAAIGVGFVIGPALAGALSHHGPQLPILWAAGFSALSILLTMILIPNAKKAEPSPLHDGASKEKPNLYAMLTAPKTIGVVAVMVCFYLSMAIYISQLALFSHAQYLNAGQKIGARELGLCFTAAGIANILVQLFAQKKLGEAFSDEKLLVGSLGLGMVAYFALGLFHNFPILLAIVLFISFSTAVARPALMSAYSISSPPQNMGMMMGANMSIMALCNIIGPVIAGAIIAHHWLFFWAVSIAGLSGLGIGIALYLFAKNQWPVRPAMAYGPNGGHAPAGH